MEDQLCEWVWLSHMDEPNGEPHHKLQHVSELEIDVMVEKYTLERTIRSIIFDFRGTCSYGGNLSTGFIVLMT